LRTRPGAVLVAARDINTLSHLDSVLGETDLEERDIVVMTVRLIQGPDAGERDLYDDTVFTDYEQRLFTQVVSLAEKHGTRLTEQDIDLIHKIWLQVSKIPARQRVHHRDVVRVALDRLERDLRGQSDVMLDFYKIEHKSETGDNAGSRDATRVEKID
jgi:hypothetical protein